MKARVEEAIEIMGIKPVNPVGSCFDSAAHQLVFGENPDDTVMCHGVGVANMPGQEGNTIGHAWLEFDHPKGRVAIDTTWGVMVQANGYREKLKVKNITTYTKREFIKLWKKKIMPGPWEENIKKIMND